MGIRKRVSRACDECRLHKARCDGINPCETCERYDRVCSYNLLPSECKGSAARIRILENRLIKANECITQLKKQTPDTGVRNPQSSLPLKELEVHQLCISPGSGTLANQDTGTRFISSLLRPLSYDPEIKALADSQSPGSLLKDNNFETSPLRTGFCQLPAYDIAIERIYTAFNSTFGLCSIIPEQTFRIATQRLYEVYPISYTQEDFEFIPLFHAIIALGMIHHSHNHLHEDAGQESLPYFEAAAFTFKDDQCLTVPKLQIRLCLVLYQLTVSRLDLARPMLQVICASSIVHSLHQSVTLSGLQDLNASDSLATNIIWTIFYVDMHISSLTQVPAFLGSPGPEMTTVYAINSAAYNVAHYRRSNREFLLSVSLAMAIELLKLIQRVFPARPSSEYQTHSVSSSKPSTSVEVGGWNKARSELQTWDYMLQNIFPENEGNLQISLAGSELKIHHCLAEILLYHSFLECLAECTAMGDYYEIDDINKGRACVTAATNAISHISGRLMQIPTSKLTWSSAYTVFISTLTLLVAAAFAHPNERHAIHGTIQIAIQILQSTTYGSSYCKKSYLDFIQALSERVMMPCDLATFYQSKSPAEPPAPSGSATTANSGSWCNSSPQDVPNMMRIQSWPTTSDGEILEEWGFDAE